MSNIRLSSSSIDDTVQILWWLIPLYDDLVDVLFLEYLSIFFVLVPFKLIEKYFSSDCVLPFSSIFFT